MKKLTTEQEKAKQDRMALAETPIEQTDADAAPPATLRVCLGQEEDIRLGARSLRLAMFRTRDVERAYSLMDKCPAILTAQALCAKDGEPIDVAELTQRYNDVTGRDGSREDNSPKTMPEVAELLANCARTIAALPELQEIMLDLALLALQRREPSLTRAEIEDEFDLGWFVSFERALLRVNTGLHEFF